MKRLQYIAVFVLLLGCLSASAQVKCSSALTEELCSAVGFSVPAEPGTTIDAGEFQGLPVKAVFDSEGICCHIGFDLFDDEIEELFPAGICRFIERYFLELLTWNKTSMLQKISDDHVTFTTGIAYDIDNFKEDWLFRLDRQDNSRYEASWSVGNTTILAFSFPIQYELLLGMPQIEIEKKLQKTLEEYLPAEPFIETSKTEEIGGNIFRTAPSFHYYVEELNDCRYYISRGKGRQVPLFSSEHPSESAANMFHMDLGKDIRMQIRQSLYGFENVTYEIDLTQWLGYCDDNGLTTYFGVEDADEESIKAVIICESKDMGYNHLLSVAIPMSFTTDEHIVLKCKLNAYIPTHNLKSLYQEEIKKQ